MQTDSFAEIGSFVSRLAQLRGLRGELISPKELRYVDLQRAEKTEQEVAAAPESLARMRCGVLGSSSPDGDRRALLTAKLRGFATMKQPCLSHTIQAAYIREIHHL